MRASAAPMFRALKHPNYRHWATADFVSVTGAWMQNLALNWFVLVKTGSPAMLGLSLFFQTLPGVVLAPLAGAMADRWPTRRVLFTTQGLHGVLALVLAGVAWVDGPLSVVYATALIGGVVTVFDGPALGRFGSQLVPREDLSNALALGSIISSGGRILGMGLAGALVVVTGVPLLFLLNALSFAAVLFAISRVRPEGMFQLATSAPGRAGAIAGLRYVFGQRPLVLLFLLSFVLSCLGRNYQVTMAAMSAGPLQAGAAGYGVLSVVFAAGTIAGGFVAAACKQLTLRLVLVMALVTSVLQFFSGAAPTLEIFAAVLFPIAVGAVVLDTATSTRIQLDTDEDMRGRVLAAKGMVTALSGAVGGPLLGWLSEVSGADHALEVAGLVTALATAVAWMLFARSPQRRAMPAHTRWAHLVPPSAATAAESSGGTRRVPDRPSRGPRWTGPGRRLTRRLRSRRARLSRK
ncbi:Predicted arabinose efflux permease, MFS family [Saccharopolyspora antimicrobica]|uniref:MFS family arabinose efflux permease n=1 Tax=Saccharopolyspora antimicrobica TaxID=455193 RepID=A0A1I5KWK5_9PSEU|nr:MFS transporter [Saccharopolyspora antimicrobica]RKT89117.1 putative MFS family arabinose efflux permease [Saccharopolyspora antimicrobica]SFO88831.1 Predicted arabinose efflux permease, MFS family [Saccharopolyspora antimicrobica]